ncbi:MAG: hypothetical protein KKD35_00250 [Elusimicrobia bacterium]|nr:hypothetical protein [Elusimicrobiota bacterium]
MKLNYPQIHNWHESVLGSNPYLFDLKSVKKSFFNRLFPFNKRKTLISLFIPCLIDTKLKKAELLAEMVNIYYFVLKETEKKILYPGRFTESDTLEYNFLVAYLNYSRFPLFKNKSEFGPALSNKIYDFMAQEMFISSVALSLKNKKKAKRFIAERDILFCIDNSPVASCLRLLLKSLKLLKKIPIADANEFSKIWARCLYFENNFALEKKFMSAGLRKKMLSHFKAAEKNIFDLFLTVKARSYFKDTFYGTEKVGKKSRRPL